MSSSSFAFAHQAQENILEGALSGVEVLELDSKLAQALQQHGNLRMLLIGAVGVFQFVSRAVERQAPVLQFAWNCHERLWQNQRELLLTELFHQLRFFL